MKKINPDIAETKLSATEAKRLLDQLLNAEDEDEGEEVMLAQPLRQFIKSQAEQQMQLVFLREMVLNVHWCLHNDDADSARHMLCIAVGMILPEVPTPPKEVMQALIEEMNLIALQRAKGGCQGSA